MTYIDRVINLGILALPKISKAELLKMSFLFAGYFIVARLGSNFLLTTNSGPALIWAPAGIAIAALYLGGYSLWPAIALASISNSILNGSNVLTMTGVALGNVLQALIGVYILNRFGFDKNLSRLKDILLLFWVSVTVTTIAPTIGLGSAWLSGSLATSAFGTQWAKIWLGCIMSVIVVTPFIVSWFSNKKIGTRNRIIEGSIVFALYFLIIYFVTFQSVNQIIGISMVYLMLLPLFWLGLRFGPRQVVAAIFGMAVLGLVGILYGPEDLTPEQIGQRLYSIELFTIIIAMIFYILSAVSEERKTATNKLLSHVKQLEEAVETIRHYALHDTLTGLPNRKAMEERFDLAKSMALRHNRKMALLFLDLDRFKNINDTLGHTIGDMILVQAAERLKNAVREVDTVARLGGDEFIVVLSEVDSVSDIENVAIKIMSAFTEAMNVQGNVMTMTTSIGIAVFPEAGEDINTLLKCADIALYRAKDKGRECFQFYDQAMKHSLHAKLTLEQDLRRAISNQELKLSYQPYIDLRTNKLMGVEALMRWQHPVLGLLAPMDFIPLAEETGLIMPIGNWLIKKSCKQIKAWNKLGLQIPISINLSAAQFSGSSLVSSIIRATEKFGIDPCLLELEITESIAMQNKANAAAKLQELSELGFSITMDDFGTGYSSLSHLKGMHIKKLKIDQSFIRGDVLYNPQDSTIVRTIISMGHTLGLKVCAEGVENNQQKMLLNSMGCDYGQGYGISRPIMAEDFEIWRIQHEKKLVAV